MDCELITKRFKSIDGTNELKEEDNEGTEACSNKNQKTNQITEESDLNKCSPRGATEITNRDSGNRVSVSDNDDTSIYTFPPDDDIVDMMTDVEFSIPFPSVTNRYFTPYYKISVQKPGDDICIWIHSNRICMISLAPSHNILQNGNKILKVNFKISEKLDRASNKVSGKGKHGAQPLQENSDICAISTSDGQTQMIKCCIIGKLLEVNEELLENPELLREAPHNGGYLAIVLPNIKLLDKMRDALLTLEQYEAVIAKQD